MTRDVLTMEGRSDWGRYDFGTFRRRDVLTMGRFDCKASQQSHISCHSSKQNLEAHGISSRAGSFIFVMGTERADFAAVSSLI